MNAEIKTKIKELPLQNQGAIFTCEAEEGRRVSKCRGIICDEGEDCSSNSCLQSAGTAAKSSGMEQSL